MVHRRHTRFAHFELVERYDQSGTALLEKGRVTDISENGLQYKGDVQLTVGDRYKFRFELGGEYFSLIGDIVRVSQNPLDHKFTCGVKFLITPLQEERLNLLLARSRKKPIL